MLEALGDRMKGYEAVFNGLYPNRLPLIIRCDGVHFSTQVKKWKCQKPFDQKLIDTMAQTAKFLCEQINGAQIAYVQSDEISILVRNDSTLTTEPWFGNKINKVISVSASMATKAFNYYFGLSQFNNPISHLAEFDCRGFVVPENDIYNVFLWRQRDASKNSIQMLARTKFSHKELHGINTNDIQNLLLTKYDINWNSLPTYLKRGLCIIKKEETIVHEGQEPIKRFKWNIDLDIPIFSENKDYIERYRK